LTGTADGLDELFQTGVERVVTGIPFGAGAA
jgi:hypothetical protein